MPQPANKRAPYLNDLARRARRIGGAYVPIPRRLRDILRWARRWTIHFDIAPPQNLKPGLALIGYPRAEFGLGEALRLVAAALETTCLPFTAFDIDHGISARQGDDRLAHRISASLDRRVNFLVHSPSYLRHAVRLLGPAAFSGRRNVLYAFWELPELPEAWIGDLAMFDEIWAPSRFVASALSAKLSQQIFLLPLPLELPQIPPRTRADFGLPSDCFLFHFSFDFSSMAERKNPWAVISAFRKCLASMPTARIGLVLKTMGDGYDPIDRRRLQQAIGGATDIFLIDSVLDRQDVLALQSLCDCFVSLHRCEGWGLGIAEAMALGKAVIATNFGGATDFLASEHACPVGYRLVPIPAGHYPGGEGQYWAAPDLEEAAACMRKVAENPDWAKRLGAAGQAFARRNLAPEIAGLRIRQRLAMAAGISDESDEASPALAPAKQSFPSPTGPV
jgi:glycosyltransferase involved in cell wall biosynthesis